MRIYLLLPIIILFALSVKAQFNQQLLCEIGLNNLVYSQTDNLIYGVDSYGEANYLIRIDPVFCVRVDSIAMPFLGQLKSISEDKNKLFFRVQDQGLLVFDIVDQTFEDLISLGEEDNEPFNAQFIMSIPGSENSYLVIKDGDSWTDSQVAVYDGAVERPLVYTQTFTPDLLVMTDSVTVFGYNSDSSSQDFFKFTITEEGISFDYRLWGDNSPAPSFVKEMTYHDSLIYFTDGTVVDPLNGLPTTYGQYEFEDIVSGSRREFVIDTYIDVIWWLWEEPLSSIKIAAYDLKTFDLYLELDVGYQDYLNITAGEFLALSEGNLAFKLKPSNSGTQAWKWCFLSNCLNPILEPPLALDTINVCEGDTVLIDAEEGYDHYVWSSGQTTQSISAFHNFSASSATFEYSYQYIDDQGCVSPAAQTIVYYSQYPGYVPLFEDVDDYGACIGQPYPLTPSSYSDLDILWSTGDLADTLWTLGGISNMAQYVSENGICLSDTSEIVTVEDYGVLPPSYSGVQYEPMGTLCAGELLTLTVLTDASDLHWYSEATSFWYINSESNVLELDVSDYAYGPRGNMNLILKNEFGCETEVDSIQFSYVIMPTFVIFNYSPRPYGDLCVQFNTNSPEHYFDYYDWYYNDEFIESTVHNCIDPTFSGEYSVVAHKEFCSMNYSKYYEIPFTEYFSTYFDSSGDMFVVNHGLVPFKSYNLVLYDMYGRRILDQELNSENSSEQIHAEGLRSAIYFISIVDETLNREIYSEKVAVIR